MDSLADWDHTDAMAGKADMVLPEMPAATWRSVPRPGGLIATVALVGAAILFGHWQREALPSHGHSLVFLSAVLLSAVSFGFWAGLIAAALAFLAYNFFFVPPLYTFSVGRAEDVLALAVFLLVAALTGFLAGRMREEAAAARHRADMLEVLSGFSMTLAIVDSIGDIEVAMLRHLARVSGTAVVLLGRDGERVAVLRREPPNAAIDAADQQAADRALRHGVTEPATAQGWEGSRYSFHPLPSADGLARVVGIARMPSRRAVSLESEAANASILRHGAMAIERFALARAAVEAREKADREAMRSALLSSLSHDLRTPLATILGSVTSLRQLDETLTPDARADLLAAIEEETGRLARYVSNLLHMTRLQSGLDLRLDWIDPVDVTHGAVARMRQACPVRAITFDTAGPVPLIHADAALLEQAVVNIIENAVKFSPPDTPVRVLVGPAAGLVRISVTDQGSGIPAQQHERVFDVFFRGNETGAPGTGLGLAICQGIIQALGGTIRVESPVQAGRGTTMHVSLPVTEPRPA